MNKQMGDTGDTGAIKPLVFLYKCRTGS